MGGENPVLLVVWALLIANYFLNFFLSLFPLMVVGYGNDSLRTFFTFGMFWPVWLGLSNDPLWPGLPWQYVITSNVDVTLASE